VIDDRFDESGFFEIEEGVSGVGRRLRAAALRRIAAAIR
jgi:hypothetical protein